MNMLQNSDVRLDFVDHQFNNWTALHWACFGSDDKMCTECVEILVNDSRCNSDLVNSKNIKGDTPISHAVFKGNYEAVKILSSYPGINMNSKENVGNSLITIAETQCGKRFADKSKIQRTADILSLLREKQQYKTKHHDYRIRFSSQNPRKQDGYSRNCYNIWRRKN